jgi:hypothetical protein
MPRGCGPARARATLTSIGSFRKEHYAEGVWAIWEKALANDPTLAALSTLTSIAPLRKSGRTQLQREHYAERVLAIYRTIEEIERGSVEAALRRRNWRRDGTTGHWIPPEVHRLPPDGFIEQSAAERRDK